MLNQTVRRFMRYPLRLPFKRYAGTYKVAEYKCHLLKDAPASTGTITKAEALKIYRDMTMIRRMENACAALYRAKTIRGFCHLYNGQEAIACGIFNQMIPDDTLITSYRAHGYTYLFTQNAEIVIAELAGWDNGVSRGKGGSMHMYAPQFFGGNGIVGSQVPMGTGAGLANKYKKNKGLSFTLFGDGAANQGQVYECQNMAKLWNLPVVYVVENNLYGMGTSSKRSSANTEYYRMSVYIPGILVDGMDVIAVRNSVDYARKHVMKGNGPIILEMLTYRYFGHSMSDPGSSYRSREEIAKVRETRDPIKKFGEKVLSDGLVKKEELDAVNNDTKKLIEEIVRKVQAGKEVALAEMTYDIEKNMLSKWIRGLTIFQKHPHKNHTPPLPR